MESMQLLQRLAEGWNKRARVCSDVDLEIAFDLEKDDFLEELLPFHAHPYFQSASPEMRSKVLSSGWIAYNAKTIAIETDIVNPVCLSLLADEFNGVTDFLTKRLITETLVDESYHIHLCLYGNETTKQQRKLQITTPFFEFINKMRRLQADYPENWKKKTIQLVTSIVTEIYITDYLALVSKAATHPIQPLNTLIVKTHRSDELVHGKIFDHLAKTIFHSLNKKEQQFFAEILPQPLTWLADAEFDLWLHILNQISFPNAEKMINDCRHQPILQEANEGVPDLLVLADELGIVLSV